MPIFDVGMLGKMDVEANNDKYRQYEHKTALLAQKRLYVCMFTALFC